MIMCFPTFAFTLSRQQQIQIGDQDGSHLRIFLVVAEESDTHELIKKEVSQALAAERRNGNTLNIEFESVQAINTAKALVRSAEASNAELAVVTTHGRSRLAQIIKPSIAESLTTFCECPVLSTTARTA